MTTIELRQKLISQIQRMSLKKLLFLESLIQGLEEFFPDNQVSNPSISMLNSGDETPWIQEPKRRIETHFLSESALGKDWLSVEEDRAWQDL